MNAKTLEAVERHGRQLLALFPNAAEQNPVALCKKLRRIETAIERPLVDYCNGTTTIGAVDTACDAALLRVRRLLGITEDQAQRRGLHVNRDPRGYALKFSDDWARDKTIYRDWGGYGIVAPDLTEE